MKKKKKGSSRPRTPAPGLLDELGRYKAVAQMVGGLVHQFRTPLHIIRSSTEELLAHSGIPSEGRPHLDLINRSAQRLDASVTAVLNFIKGEKLALRPGSLNDTLEQLGDFLSEECRKTSVTVQKQLQARHTIALDPHYLQEALLNLLTNAIQAMPNGGILTITSQDAGPLVHLEIKDTGVGMDKAALANWAKPFQTTKKQGMGLGVFLTRKILDQHHAKMDVTSQKGKGTIVTVTFPAV